MNWQKVDTDINSMVKSVSELTSHIKFQLESGFPRVKVMGEVSNCTYQSSGHVYFTIKDSYAALSCVMFRSVASKVDFRLKQGEMVVLTGAIRVYEPRGSYQLNVYSCEAYGKGNLHQQFEKRKKELEEAGWFDLSQKKPLPLLPLKIGIVTSPTGAVLRDFVRTVNRRCSVGIELELYPSLVQGEEASEQLAAGVRYLQSKNVDVIVVARGGGSIEDLWAFNEMPLLEAIYQCHIPVVSSVGHETDFTLADFVADVRAATPSVAAELVVPLQEELSGRILRCRKTLLHIVGSQIDNYGLRMRRLSAVALYEKSMSQLQRSQQYLDELQARLLGRCLNLRLQKLQELQHVWPRDGRVYVQEIQSRILKFRMDISRLKPVKWKKRAGIFLEQGRLSSDNAIEDIFSSLKRLLKDKLHRLSAKMELMESLSPGSILKRGFVFMRRDDETLESFAQIKTGDRLELVSDTGKAEVIVEKVERDELG